MTTSFSLSNILARAAAARGVLVRVGIIAIAVAVVIVFASQWGNWTSSRSRQTTDNAYVRGDITPLSAKIEGIVSAVPVNDFQRVKAGDLLVAITDDDYKARVAQAEADVLAAEASIDNIKARKTMQKRQLDQAEEQVNAVKADVERSRLEAERQRELVKSTFGTAQRLEVAQADEKRFRAQLARSEADVAAQHTQLAVLDTQESELRAALKAKHAVLALARINLGYTEVKAPVDGVVSERNVRAGQYVRPGTQLITVVPIDTVWVVANYKETQLARVRPGQRVDIAIDTFPGEIVTGRVDSLAPASGAVFSLLPADNATGNFTKVVQRIPVKIALDPDNALKGRLRPGMSVVTTIHTDTPAR
ncbi:HlyD family secretion protein [Reyranella sp. CPCC 100927]|uniref:HlyD family secretion protein n=1 Tax=Reyranella sp. CPCC 100927 TaxID=2599616 RepID=UPI0011B50EDA|nr:HlyD family secretion protein [Reyranella sp. CPCC 100927]TWT10736.1 HlyD family secretion protein [Reyranella sp. CPCC 100927]